MAYNEIWDVNTPQASEARSLGDDRIRELKRGLTERLATVMNFPDGLPLEFLPSVKSGLLPTNGDSFNAASIDATKIGPIPGTQITAFTLPSGAFDNRTVIHCGYYNIRVLPTISDTIIAAGQSANWTYLASATINDGTKVPVMSPDHTQVVLNMNTSIASQQSPFNGSQLLSWSAIYDGTLRIFAGNPSASSITIKTGFTFQVGFVSSFLWNQGYEP